MSYHMSACHVIMKQFPCLAWVACSTGSTLNFSTFASMSLSMTLALALHYYSEFEMNVKSLHHSASCSCCCCWPLHPNQRHASCLAIDQDCQIVLWCHWQCPCLNFKFNLPRQYWQCHQTTGSISATVIDNVDDNIWNSNSCLPHLCYRC